jgi:dihydrofolate reductase
LEDRISLILTRNQSYAADGCQIFHHPDIALQYAENKGENEVFIIGGSIIYEIFMPQVDRLYLTIVHTQVEADTWFTGFKPAEWVEIAVEYAPANGENQYPTTFKILEKK